MNDPGNLNSFEENRQNDMEQKLLLNYDTFICLSDSLKRNKYFQIPAVYGNKSRMEISRYGDGCVGDTRLPIPASDAVMLHLIAAPDAAVLN